MIEDHFQHAHKRDEEQHAGQSPDHAAQQQSHYRKQGTQLHHAPGDLRGEKITIQLLDDREEQSNRDGGRQCIPGNERVDDHNDCAAD